MRRTRATPTEERELLPLHRPSTSLSLSVGSRPTVAPPLSPTLTQLPPPRRRASTATSPTSPPPHAATMTNSGYGYKRRETPHDAALADLNHRLTGGASQHASVNPPQSRTGGGAPGKNAAPSEQGEERAYYDSTHNVGAPGDSPTAVQSTTPTSSSYHRRAARHLSLPPPPRSSSSAPPQYEAIYDPYTGQYRGQLVPPQHASSSSYRLQHPHMSRPQRQPDSPSASTTTSSASSIKTSSSSSSSSDKEDDFLVGPPPDVNLLLSPEEKKREEDMWATLARIRVIQSEVSKKQLSLEAFAVPSAYPKDNKATTMASSEDMQGGAGGATVSPRGSISRKSGRETVAGGISDDPASVKTDKRSSKTAATASPTTANAAAAAGAGVTQPPPRDAFAQRREAIDEIVKKLDDLSSAVKQLGAHNRQPPTSSSPPTQPAHPPHQPPTLQIPATRPAGGFGWRSPSTSSYNSFKEQFNARNKQRQAGQQTPARVASPPPLQRATTAPAVTVQPPSATSPASATRPTGYPGPQNTAATPRILAVAAPAPGGYSSASSRDDYYLSSRNRQPLLYDSPASTQGEL